MCSVRHCFRESKDLLVRRSNIAECEARLFERTAHVEALRERVRRFLQQAAFLRNDRRGNNTLLQDTGSVDEGRDEPIPDVLSHMVENSEVDLQNALHDVLSDVKKSLKEDMRISHEYNEQKLEELTLRFEQLLRQQEYAHQQEVLELQGSIEYLQEKLVTDREQKEALEQGLEDANMKLLERSEEMGSIRAELSDLRKEVQELRAYKAKHRREMQNVEKLRKELEAFQAVHRLTREEFAKVSSNRED
ncbi:hypothetical protein ANCDUO_01315 [Ancylostoma duodenale]|uniref:Uncharacterized protein n=1 Tax=Ancylostoma duodenale TaxID=51022 RepID=A0A0C2DZA1_9BILA|nr:hypothetical protein ANCDUO_01315 [Ancylostoma duodenale]